LNTGALTASAGLVWHPQKDWQINFNLSTGFRAPNIDDIGKVFDSEPGSVVVPNPNLKSEYVYSAELGLMKVFASNLKLELVGFYSYLQDALVRRDFTLEGQDSIIYDGALSKVESIQNAAFAFSYGLQGVIDFNFARNFKLTSKINYQQGKEEDDSGNKVPLRHSPPLFGTTRLVYEDNKYSVIFYADYNGEISYNNLAPSEREKTAIYASDENGNPYSPAWFTLNLKLGIRVIDNLLINVSVENILDKRYRTYSSGITAPGRNFITSVKYNL
jgi:hemoglobin/transferrin/lactoferrin receptor protein